MAVPAASKAMASIAGFTSSQHVSSAGQGLSVSLMPVASASRVGSSQNTQAVLSSSWVGSTESLNLSTARLSNSLKASNVRTTQAALGENEYEVELEKPYGIKFYKGDDNLVYIDALAAGQNAARSGLIEEGDRVVATSAVFGPEVWPAAEYGRTMYCIKQRVGPLYMKMEKRFGKKQPVASAKDPYLLERSAGNYGDAVREKQIENYLKKQEMSQQRKEELTAGLALYKEGKYKDALVRFETVIELQPTGNEQAVTSYNIACCYSKLGEIDAGLAALEAAMETGFDDYKTIRQDSDLDALRLSDKFKPLINRYDEPFINENALKAISNVFGIFGGKK